MSKPLTRDQTVHPWPNRSLITKQFICEYTVYSCPNCSPMIKPFTCDQTVHSLPNRPPVSKPFTHNCSSVNKNNNNTSGASIIVTLSGTALWLWHFLQGLSLTFDTSWGIIMIVKLPCASLWLWYFICLFRIVTLPESLWLCHTSWLWNFFCNLFYCLPWLVAMAAKRINSQKNIKKIIS